MRRRGLFTQVLTLNALLAGLIVVALAAASTSWSAAGIVAVGFAASAASLLVNLILLRPRFAPLEKLIEEMEKVDLSRPGPVLPDSIDGVGETEEVERIELAFLRMMRRLEA